MLALCGWTKCSAWVILVENRVFLVTLLQARSQDFAKGGAFLRGENNSKQTWPKFPSVLNQIEAVFLSKSGDLQKKKVFTKIETVLRPKSGGLQKKKKVFIKIQSLLRTNLGCAPVKKNSTFLVQITANPSQLLLPNPVGGGCFHFWSKNRPQSYFAYFSGQLGGFSPTPRSPWRRYCLVDRLWSE